MEATARGYRTDPPYDDFDDITTLSIAGCGFDLYSFFKNMLLLIYVTEEFVIAKKI